MTPRLTLAAVLLLTAAADAQDGQLSPAVCQAAQQMCWRPPTAVGQQWIALPAMTPQIPASATITVTGNPSTPPSLDDLHVSMCGAYFAWARAAAKDIDAMDKECGVHP